MCGIVGVWMKRSSGLESRAAALAIRGLHRLQHRGHEGAGLCVSQGKGKPFSVRHSTRMVADAFPPEVFGAMYGRSATAANRYSTAGAKNDPNPERNLGPLYEDTKYGESAIAHNGNLKGASAIRQELKNNGARFKSGIDSELFFEYIAKSKKPTFREAMLETLHILPIAYAVIAQTDESLFGARDPRGVRPLWLGESDECYVFASETSAIEFVGAKVLREVEPGELLEINEKGLQSFRFGPKKRVTPRPCIFEHVYFARGDERGGAVQHARILQGKLLARNHEAPRGVIVGVPTSGLDAANGYAEELGKVVTRAIERDPYQLRAFMRPTPKQRELSVELKHAIIAGAVAGKVVTLVDDSAVRGKTLERIIENMRKAGALEVHVRIASPMVIHPCWFGIDTPSHKELFANQFKTEKEMARQLRADSIEFLHLWELIEASRKATGQKTFCTMCFDGKPNKVLLA